MTLNMKTSKKVAVVGSGYWGKNLVRNFHELGALAFVCDVSPQATKTARELAGNIAVQPDFCKLIENSSVDAVVIATPAETHFELGRRALLAGKDVFVEKPLALKYSDAETLVRIAQDKQAVVMVGHLLEYHPAVQQLRDLVLGGKLGKLQYIYSNRLNLGRVRREENILWSFAPHDIAVIIRLMGEEPIEVTACGGTYLQPNVADVTVTTMLFDNGVRAHIFVSWLHPYKEQKLVVVGTQQMAVFDDVRNEDKLVLYDQKMELVNNAFVPHKNGQYVSLALPTDEPLKLECRHFLECIDKRIQPLTDGASALRVLRVLQACQRSLQMNGKPVEVFAHRLEVVNL